MRNLILSDRQELRPLIADATVCIITGYEPEWRARVANANLPRTYYGLSSAGGVINQNFARHLGGSNVVFLDLHVETVSQEKAMSTTAFPYTDKDWW